MRTQALRCYVLSFLFAAMPLSLAIAAGAQQAPVANVVPKQLVAHGDTRIDDYYWLRERDNPEVLAYLAAENAYTEAVMAHTKALQETLFEEIVGRIKEDDASVPYRKGDYFYYDRFEPGGEYHIYCRRKGSMQAPEEIVLDGNALAKGHEFFSLRGLGVSTDQNLLTYAVDTVGRRFYTVRFRDLRRGRDLADAIPDVTGNTVWANDNKTVFYSKQHPETLRWYQIYKHVLGTDVGQDELVYEEKDAEFECWVDKTKSERFILIPSQQTLSTEILYVEADDPNTDFKVFLPRRRGHEYWIEHFGGNFLVRTNDNAANFRLASTPIASTSMANWTELIPHRDDVFLDDFDVFRDFLVVSERKAGLIQMRVIAWDRSGEHYLDFGEPAYRADFGDNYGLGSNILRFKYTSLTTPWSVYDYDMNTGEKTLRKEDPVLGGFDKDDYVTERLHAPASNGTLVPISIVYRKGTRRDGQNPMLLYGYGSYGLSIDASFQSWRLSLLDRGFIFAIAHVRGGQELGRHWYEDGKLMSKKNTFTDFIDCARYLTREKYTNRELLFAQGGSAGGLLMGAVANMAPGMFKGIVNHVPFVDVMTTMLDADIPLTTSEYDEWGNPNDEAAYKYMLSYSPYDNIEAKDYPNQLVTTGLHDSQVQYWEPAKYVAKMRALKTDNNRLLLKTNMEAGHGGASGRFKRHRETAFAYAFLLDLAGRTDVQSANRE